MMKSNKQSGMTLIEVLIGLVIIVSGIFGAVAMQATAKKSGFDAMQRSLASGLAQEILERIRNNNDGALVNLALYAANSPYGGGGQTEVANCTALAGCTSAEMVSNDLFLWDQALQGGYALRDNDPNLPVGGLVGALGCIIQNGNAVTIIVSWQGRNDISDAASTTSSVDNDGAIINTVDCGANQVDIRRRQVSINGFIS